MKFAAAAEAEEEPQQNSTMIFLADFPDFTNPAIITSLVTLIILEIILGVDNIIFISIVSNKLPLKQQPKARTIGLLLAMAFRIILLLAITWIIGLTKPVLSISLFGEAFNLSWKDIILIIGGLFLLFKSTMEIRHKLEVASTPTHKRSPSAFSAVILQIVMVDAVFSFDSILTAIGLAEDVWVMIIAVVISICVMIIFAGPISRFINKHPTLQMLALSFLIMIGAMLIAEGFHQEINKAYIYTAIAFSLGVEFLNMKLRKKDVIELNNEQL